MKWNEIIKKIKKIGYSEGKRVTHCTIWNCPCPSKEHPVGLGNHPSEECRFSGLKRQLGPHAAEIGLVPQKKKVKK